MTIRIHDKRGAILAGVLAIASFQPLAASAQSGVDTGKISIATRMQMLSLIRLCKTDFDRECPGTEPGGGRVVACLGAHAETLSPSCRQALPAAAALRDSADASGELPK